MPSAYRVLTEDQVRGFVDDGYVVLRSCFTAEAAARYTGSMWTRLGYDPDDPGTWEQDWITMPAHHDIDVREFAPTVWDASCDLLGGEDRVDPSHRWHDNLVVNLRRGADRPWREPSREAPGWHKDGDFFRHFLNSPEQALLTVVLWSPVRSRGGATVIAADSVGPVARYLRDRPEGVHPTDLDIASLIGQCGTFVEATGDVGDVYLMHPYMLHTVGQNTLRVPRVITNPALRLRAPMDFARDDPSPVEQAVLRGLGVDRYHFRQQRPAEKIVPDRVRRQREMKIAERARLGGTE